VPHDFCRVDQEVTVVYFFASLSHHLAAGTDLKHKNHISNTNQVLSKSFHCLLLFNKNHSPADIKCPWWLRTSGISLQTMNSPCAVYVDT